MTLILQTISTACNLTMVAMVVLLLRREAV